MSARFLLPFLLTSLAVGASWAGAAPASAQGPVRRHLVQFRDKVGSPFSVGQPAQFLSARAIARRQRQGIQVRDHDLPPVPAYVQQVRAVPGVAVVYRTRWMNGVIVECDSTRLAQVQALPFVAGSQTLNRVNRDRPKYPIGRRRGGDAERVLSPNPYGLAYAQANQIDATTMHAAGFRGEGMHIAVFDSGFPGVETIPAFQPLYQQNRLLSTFDVVQGGTNVYSTHPHGTWVLSTMAANEPNTFIGTAPMASYHLVRTEDTRGGTETEAEEAYWLIGAEYADSAGVDIINSSLGYTTFDIPWQNHTYATLDGNTALATRAADEAAAVGILVVNSAGNEGGSSWQYVGVPADADSILTIGAVDSMGIRAGFSSVGPTPDGRIKPNIACMGAQTAVIDPSGFAFRGNGTSFSSPVLAGMAAGFWQANPNLTAQQVRSFLEQSGTQAAAPDNLLGYGIPSFVRAYNLANPNNPLNLPAAAAGLSVPELYPNPVPGAAFGLRLPARLVGLELTVRISDATGRAVSEQRVKAAAGADSVVLSVEKSAMKAGVYICELRAPSGEHHTLRFVKE